MVSLVEQGQKNEYVTVATSKKLPENNRYLHNNFITKANIDRVQPANIETDPKNIIK